MAQALTQQKEEFARILARNGIELGISSDRKSRRELRKRLKLMRKFTHVPGHVEQTKVIAAKRGRAKKPKGKKADEERSDLESSVDEQDEFVVEEQANSSDECTSDSDECNKQRKQRLKEDLQNLSQNSSPQQRRNRPRRSAPLQEEQDTQNTAQEAS